VSDTHIEGFGIQVAWLDEQLVRLDILLVWLATLLNWLNVVVVVVVATVADFTSVFTFLEVTFLLTGLSPR